MPPAPAASPAAPLDSDFYSSRIWRRVRRQVMDEHHWECQACKARGRLSRATLVHHEIPAKDRPDLALTPYLPTGGRQLTPLCHDCHEEIETKRGNRPGPTEPLTEEWW